MNRFSRAKECIERSVNSGKMCLVVGDCNVEYFGRAASKLPKGKRLLLIKGDGSFAIHQNKLLRPTNYMMDAAIKCGLAEGKLTVSAAKVKPKETIRVFFDSVEFFDSFELGVQEKSDLRLFGSEKELSGQLMEDLSFIEAGMKALKAEMPVRKGVMDIIAEDSKGRIAVIEVKRRKAGFNAVSQLQRYVRQLKKMKGRETRGILLAPGIQKNALEMLEQFGLEFKELEFEISNPKAKIKGVGKGQHSIKDLFGGKKNG